eukprot:m.1333955 g.1333955  ORF g.1333955 m.1333955 type:complete len:58 (+) comp24872_c0_seq12:2225-2398(+)
MASLYVKVQEIDQPVFVRLGVQLSYTSVSIPAISDTALKPVSNIPPSKVVLQYAQHT